MTSDIESAIHNTNVETISQPQINAAGPPELKQGPNVTIQLGKTAIVLKANPACTNKLISRLNSCL